MIPAICIASGPSLTQEDVDYCRGMGKVYVVNDSYRLAPWADVLYACDEEWWNHHNGVPEFPGEKFTINKEAAAKYDLQRVNANWHEAFYIRDNTIALGKNGGFQAMNLAALHGHTKIVLLGYDMKTAPDGKRHWFGEHPPALIRNSDYKSWIKSFSMAAPLMRAYDIEVINASRETALTCFQRMDLEAALC